MLGLGTKIKQNICRHYRTELFCLCCQCLRMCAVCHVNFLHAGCANKSHLCGVHGPRVSRGNYRARNLPAAESQIRHRGTSPGFHHTYVYTPWSTVTLLSSCLCFFCGLGLLIASAYFQLFQPFSVQNIQLVQNSMAITSSRLKYVTLF